MEEDITMKDSRATAVGLCRRRGIQWQNGVRTAAGTATLMGWALAASGCSDQLDSTQLRELDVPVRAQPLGGTDTSISPLLPLEPEPAASPTAASPTAASPTAASPTVPDGSEGLGDV